MTFYTEVLLGSLITSQHSRWQKESQWEGSFALWSFSKCPIGNSYIWGERFIRGCSKVAIQVLLLFKKMYRYGFNSCTGLGHCIQERSWVQGTGSVQWQQECLQCYCTLIMYVAIKAGHWVCTSPLTLLHCQDIRNKLSSEGSSIVIPYIFKILSTRILIIFFLSFFLYFK